MSQQPVLNENPIYAYLTGAMVMFLSALLASQLPITFIMVMCILSVPSLFIGYYFAPVFTKYSLGLLTGLCIYMVVEYYIYGPIYKVTGLVYAAAYIFAVASVLLARLIYIRKQLRKK